MSINRFEHDPGVDPKIADESGVDSAKVEDIDEARARALAEKPFRDVAVGRPDTDRDVLERVADEQGDKAGQEFREIKELLPTEVIKKLSKDLAEKLEAGLKWHAESFPKYFEELMRVLKTELVRFGKGFGQEDIVSLAGYYKELNLIPKRFDGEDLQNALYSVLGVGESADDVFNVFRRLSENKKQEVAALVGQKVGNVMATIDTAANVVIPTKIDGILLEIIRFRGERTSNIKLLFTPEFLERAIKDSSK